MAFSVSVGQAIQFLFRRRREGERRARLGFPAGIVVILIESTSNGKGEMGNGRGRRGGRGFFLSAGKVGLKAEQHVNRDEIGFI